jgi:peroxiredoxin
MLMKKTVCIILLTLPFLTSAQDFKVTGKISGMTEGKITVVDFYGNENKAIDSVSIAPDGSFVYQFGKYAQPGMYRLRWGNNQLMDVIFNNENIRFTTHSQAVMDSLVFLQSTENQLYLDYLKRRNENEYKLELLYPLLSRYPADDPFYENIREQYDRVNSDLEQHVATVTEMQPQTLAARIIHADFTPRPPSSLDEPEHINYLKVHFFDNIDFTDTDLLYTNVISNKLIQYLSLYQNNRFSKDQLQVEFIKAVSVMMEKTQVNPAVYEYAMDYLITGFDSYGFDKVITYIADNIHLDDQCYDDERKAELEKKVESLKKFSVGKQVPDFSATDLDGNPVTLSETNSEFTLLVFWATWCPHCTQVVKELRQIYLPDNKHKLEIVAVSLDESPDDLEAFFADGGFDWINICDYKKWQGEIVQQFDIYATPTMFLLEDDLTIAAKPMSIAELRNELFIRNVLK